jgi:hypothetical protein
MARTKCQASPTRQGDRLFATQSGHPLKLPESGHRLRQAIRVVWVPMPKLRQIGTSQGSRQAKESLGGVGGFVDPGLQSAADFP